MSDLRPIGVPVMMNGVERHFLFTLNVIDEIQDHYDMAMDEVLDMLSDNRKEVKTLKYLVKALLDDEIERNPDQGLEKYTEQEIGWMITQDNHMEYMFYVLRAYGISMPETEEDDVPN